MTSSLQSSTLVTKHNQIKLRLKLLLSLLNVDEPVVSGEETRLLTDALLSHHALLLAAEGSST